MWRGFSDESKFTGEGTGTRGGEELAPGEQGSWTDTWCLSSYLGVHPASAKGQARDPDGHCPCIRCLGVGLWGQVGILPAPQRAHAIQHRGLLGWGWSGVGWGPCTRALSRVLVTAAMAVVGGLGDRSWGSRRHDQIFLSRISHGSLELSPSQTSQIEAPQEPLRGSMGVLGYRWLPILPSRGWASEPPSGSGLACNLLGPIKSDGRDVWELWKLGPMVPCSFHLL